MACFMAPAILLAFILLGPSMHRSGPGLVLSDGIDFFNCDSDVFDYKLSEVTEVSITGCDEDDCIITDNSSIDVVVELVPEINYEEVVLNLDVNTDLVKHLISEDSICGKEITCPIIAGETVHLERKGIKIDIPFFLPESMLENLELNATIVEKKSKRIVACIVFFVTVKK